MVPEAKERLPLNLWALTGAASYFIHGLPRLSPAVSFGDAGELTAAAAALALPHPPSFPLYVLAAKAFGTAAPFANWAYRTNLFSLVCGSAAVALAADAGAALGLSRPAAAFGALFFAAAPQVLHECLTTEVFALLLLWAALGARLAAGLREPTSEKGLAALGLWLGLGAAQHQTLALAAPAVAFAAWAKGGRPRPTAIAAGLPFFALGLAIYLFLPLRSASRPPLDWGHPTSLAGVARVFLRKDYGSLALTVGGAGARTAASLWAQLERFGSATLSAYGLGGAALCLLGALLWRGSLPVLFPLGWLVLAGPLFLILGNPPFNPELNGALTRFYLLPWLPLAWLAASAADWFASRIGRGAVLCVVLLGLVLAAGRPACALRWDLAPYDYVRDTVKSLPRGSVFFIDGGDDTFYTLAWWLYAEGGRPDLEPHDRGGLVFPSVYGPDFRSLSPAEKKARRVQVESSAIDAGAPVRYSTMDPELLPGRTLLPAGLVMSPKPAPSPWPAYVFRYDAGLGRSWYRDRALAPIFPFMRGLSQEADGDLEDALASYRLAAAEGPDVAWLSSNVAARLAVLGYRASSAGRWPLAERIYRRMVAVEPLRSDGWANLGVCLEKQGRLEEAAEADERAARVDGRSADAWYDLGVVRWRQERWRDAAAAFEKAVELKPGEESWRRYLAQARARAGERR